MMCAHVDPSKAAIYHDLVLKTAIQIPAYNDEKNMVFTDIIAVM